MSGKNIVIAQQKGGSGKTTLSIHLAVALSQMGFKVAFLDADPQETATSWYNVRKSVFGDFVSIYFKTISGWNVANEELSIKDDYDFVIIDTPPHIQTDARSAINMADLILIPIQPSPADLWASKATINEAIKQDKNYCLVFNRSPHNSKIAREIEKDLGKKPIARLSNRVAMASSIYKGKTVTETNPSSPASQEVHQLVQCIQEIFQKEKNEKAA